MRATPRLTRRNFLRSGALFLPAAYLRASTVIVPGPLSRHTVIGVAGPPTSGLVARWESDSITGLSNNDPVATWPDTSGNSRDATQSSSSLKPLYKTNILGGKPALLFDGSDDELNFTSTPLTNFTVAMVTKLSSLYSSYQFGMLQWSAASGDKSGFSLNDTSPTVTPHITIFNSSGTETANKAMGISYDPAVVVPHIAVWTYNGSTVAARDNGASQSTSNQDSGYNSGAGKIGFSYQHGKGYLCALLVYNTVLSGSDITQLETYLNGKFPCF